MTRMQSLMAGTAVAALLAVPAHALSVDADAGLGLSLDTSLDGPAIPLQQNEESRDSGVSAEGTGGQTQTVVTVEPQGTSRGDTMGGTGTTVDIDLAAVVDPEFVGDTVLSADGQVLGVVEGVADNGSGMQKVVVALDTGVIAQMDEKRVSFLLDPRARSDGQIQLEWTKAEFEEAIDEEFRQPEQSKS